MYFQERIEHLIEAGFQAISVPTSERSRCEKELSLVARKLGMKFVTWDGVNGYITYDKDNRGKASGDSKDPLEALLALEGRDIKAPFEGDALLVFRNFHVFLDDPAVCQQFQNLYYGRKFSSETCGRRPMIILANSRKLNDEIAPCITMAEFSLPDEKQLTQVFIDTSAGLITEDAPSDVVATYTDEQQSRVVQAMRGLTQLEAENVLAYGLRLNRGFGPGLVDTIEDQKASQLEKSEVLTYTPKDKIASMTDIGGYDELKRFINERRLAYSRKAREVRLDEPRGIVLLGVPGTGKSLVGKIIAKALGLPLVLFNVSAVFGSLVGQSEQRVRSALATIDALDGAVLLVDEAEKALGGLSDAGGDSGVSRRVFGVLLTWLAEKSSRTFVVMTMNRTRGIPPEFLRKGRFDEIFYTDLPDANERDQILRIHCRKRDVDVAKFTDKEWTSLIDKTDKFVGAELEQIICDARFRSFAVRESGQPNMDELLAVAEIVVPIADAEKENIEDIRQICTGRARSVSRPKDIAPVAARSRTIKVA